MFKNKHVIVAVIVAPILAILSYLGVDRLVAEQPHAAKQNASYPLAAKSSCRYASGECRLTNGEVDIVLKPIVSARQELELELASTLPIEGAKVAIVEGDEVGLPVAFSPRDDQKLLWNTRVAPLSTQSTQLRLVVVSGGATFFAEVDTVFLQPPEQRSRR